MGEIAFSWCLKIIKNKVGVSSTKHSEQSPDHNLCLKDLTLHANYGRRFKPTSMYRKGGKDPILDHLYKK